MTATIFAVVCPNYVEECSQIVFPDVAKAFTLGKTKCRYTMLYGIAPEIKGKLIFDVNSSPFYFVTFDESMNSEPQMC